MAEETSFQSPLSFVHWDITARCNLKCLHCRETFCVDEIENEFSTEEGKDLIDYLADNFT
jgi:MoaA/NifB/PqqE/SkfB family radical SAM enzyme